MSSASSESVQPDKKDSLAQPSGQSRRIVRNSVGNLASQLTNAACNLAVIYIFTRRLEQATVGEYFVIFAMLQAVQMILESGFTTVLTLRIAQDRDNWRQHVAQAWPLFIGVVLASIVVLTSIGGAWSLWKGDAEYLAALATAALACAAIQLGRFTTAVYRGFDRFHLENAARLGQGLLFAGFAYLFVFGEASHALTRAVGSFAASHLISWTVLAVMLQWQYGAWGWQTGVKVFRDWMHTSVPLGAGDVVRRLTWQLDTLLLGLLQPAAVVSIYSVAYRPLGPLNWIPRAFLLAAFPSLARLATDDRDELGRVIATSVRLLWALSLPIAITICFLAKPIVLTLAGEKYLESVLPMQLLIWIVVMSFLSIQFRFLFSALGENGLFARLVIGVFVLQVALQISLIPWLGYFGSIIGTLVGEIAFSATGLYLCRKMRIQAVQWKPMLLSLFAGGGMALTMWLIPGEALYMLAVRLLLSLCVYAACCVILRVVHIDEFAAFAAAFTRRKPKQATN